MREELGKWLLDISKYIVTAVIFTSVFAEVRDTYYIYCLGIIITTVCLFVGLFLIKDSRKSKEKK